MSALYNPEPEPDDDWRHAAMSVTTSSLKSFSPASTLEIFEKGNVWLELAYYKNALAIWDTNPLRMANQVDEIKRPPETILAGTRDIPGNILKVQAQSVPCGNVKTESDDLPKFNVEDPSMLSVWMTPRFDIGRNGKVLIWALLTYGVTATIPTPGTAATGGLRPGIPAQPSKPPAPPRQHPLIDTLIFGSGSVMCVALVVGARYWRGSWGLPAPAMGASSIAFLLWKNDEDIAAEVTWM
ncbi:uncharacterized protein N0V89_009098 [Didymosphaeria variabile]|uniref:Uncharacterized protein n=1 Tax=Didymosphaeria variabile TaxID=1932322 RepID=A0A9W8XIV7_9PLEO|nr:uncharacterized protein N0V89_009098 [Didymosphaeria variabile]KAJ4350477.1 hypothetical protein N0V89_009098 [Didymosphaeria variabile]